MIETVEKTFFFAEFELDTAKRLLLKAGRPLTLNPKAFDLLAVLVKNHGRILNKNELLETVWEGQFVEENNLSVQISALRKIFDEKKGTHRFIVTVPGKGYKFVAELNGRNDNEIVVATHTFERVVIEEIENDGAGYAAVAIELDRSSKTGFHQPKSVRNWFTPNRLIIGCLAVSVIILGGGYLRPWFVWSDPAAGNRFAGVTVRQLTTNGKVVRAALAPDGKTFAYVIDDFGRRSLWLGYVDGGNHRELRPAVTDSAYFNLTFAPDSNQLYFSYRDDKTPAAALYRIHISGGAAEKIADAVANFSLAPDGRQIGFGRRGDENDSLIVADPDGANEREIASFPKKESFVFDSLSWSPDGRRLAFSRFRNALNGEQDLAVVEISSGKIDSFRDDSLREITKTLWLKDGGGVIVSALKTESQASVLYYNIFLIDMPGGKVREITGDLSSYAESLDLSPKSDAILTIEHRQLNNIWIAPADDLSAARQITFGSFGKYDGLWGLDFTPAGKIIYTNSDTKSQFISEMNADGSGSKPLTTPGKVDSLLSVSNDGRYIVFHSNRNSGGGMDIWRMDADGRNPKQLTFGGRNFQPFVSADSRWVYYKSLEKDAGALRRVSIDGGEPQILNERETSWLSFSPDGRFFAAAYRTDKSRLAIFDAATNEVVKQFDLPKNTTMSIGSRWSPDSRAVAYRDWNDGYWLQPVTGGEPQKMPGLPKEKLYNFAWSKDGKQFAFVRGQEIRDVVLINDAR
jgi:DNA-binding winged helix-turn-helix (wHTH) protein/Tol biopolymer transport system component